MAKSMDGATCALLNLRKTTRAVTQLYDEILRPSGLKGTQYSLMRVIRAKEPVSIGDLSEIMVMDRTTATRNLRLLELAGLIRVEPGDDRRVRLARLTRRGRSALQKATHYWEKAQQLVVDGFGPDRYDRFRAELVEMTSLSQGELQARSQ